MDKAQAKKWAEALRSGEFTQQRHALRSTGNPKQLCCLGVAACVLLPSQWQDIGTTGRACNALGLSFEVQELFIDMNDWQKASFNQIADEVERRFCQ